MGARYGCGPEDGLAEEFSRSGYHAHASEWSAASAFAQRAQAEATRLVASEQRVANLIAYLAQVPQSAKALRAQLVDEIEERLGLKAVD